MHDHAFCFFNIYSHHLITVYLILRSIISFSCLEFSEFLVVTCSSFVGINVQNIIFSSFFRNIGLEHHQLFCFGRGISNSNRWKSCKSYFNIPNRCGRPKNPTDFTNQLPYRFTIKYAIVIVLKMSEMQNALRIPLNADFQFCSFIASFDTERKYIFSENK